MFDLSESYMAMDQKVANRAVGEWHWPCGLGLRDSAGRIADHSSPVWCHSAMASLDRDCELLKACEVVREGGHGLGRTFRCGYDGPGGEGVA